MRKMSHRNLAGIMTVLGVACLVSTLLLAEDYNFAGTWKGELGATPSPAPGAAAGGASSGGATSGAATGGTATKGGGGRGGGGGGFGGGFGGNSGPQKITLRVASVNKEKGTAKGNFTMGSAGAEDIREAKVVGNKLTFKTGLAPATIYEYEAVIIGEELSVTRTSTGGRGGGFPLTFKLTRNK